MLAKSDDRALNTYCLCFTDQDQTRNIIGSINRSGTVGRFIYTSSTAAVSFSGTVNEEGLDHLIAAPVLYEDRDIEAVADSSFRQGDALKVSFSVHFCGVRQRIQTPTPPFVWHLIWCQQ